MVGAGPGTTSDMANVKRPQDVQVAPKRHKKKKGGAWMDFWAKVATFDLLKLFEPKRPPPVPRTIYVDLPLPPEIWEPTKHGHKQLKDGVPSSEVERKVGKQASKSWQYPSNQVLTSKYNVITFIPKNLLEQFRRVANIFFLILVILQFFPRFTNVSPALAAMPLLVVLAITALKDGYEDLKRHQSDRFINNIGTHVLAGPTVHNPNLTIAKSTGLSMKWVGRLFPWMPYFGTRGAAKRAARDSEKAAQGLDSHGNARQTEDTGEGLLTREELAERQSLAGGKKNWWGTRKRAVSSASSKKRLGGLLSSSTPAPNGPGSNVHRVQTILYDEEDENGITRTTSRLSRLISRSHQTDDMPAGEGDADGSPGINRAHWRKTVWEDVRVGDFVRLRDNDSIPADIIICATSEEENVCYIETKNLDGETNLKARSAVPELTHIRSAKAASKARFLIKSEAPDVNMFKYSAAVEMHDGQVGKDGEPARSPVNLNTVLLRGCVLRNTEWVIGIVVFTGIDTKIVMNSGGTPSKRSKVERAMNPMVFLNLFLLALMCVMCALGDHFMEAYYYERNAYWEFGANRSDDAPNINGLVAFANAMITFQNIVPISLYISIEFVRTVQAFYIWADDDIMYTPTGRRTLARSWNLSDDLGQIEYIFSDKTGTLTQNIMQFRHCSIGGVVFKGDEEIPSNTIVPDKHPKEQAIRQDEAENIQIGNGSAASSSGDETRVQQPSSGEDNIGVSTGEKQVKLPAEVSAPFHDKGIDEAIAQGGEQGDRVAMFFTNLGLCHTVLAGDDGEGHLVYKAQSPDEAALVQAAADAGFVFRGRDRDTLHLQVPNSSELQKYELLNTLEFTSARKRMSVLLRRVDDGDGDPSKHPIILFAKGADNVIFERLVAGDERFKKTTDEHLEEFASEGLRTLTLAWKTLTQEEYDEWAAIYHTATVQIDNRDEEIEKASGLIENGLRLLGATAIEDKLQDGVPEAIADLKRAGIKVWVATGDKLETAIAIGMSSNLLARDMNLIIIRGGAYGEPKSAYDQMHSALTKFFDAQAEIDNFENQPPGLSRPTSRSRPSLQFTRSQSRRRSHQLERTNTGLSGLSEFIDENNGSKPGGYGLVIDGSSLQHALTEEYSKEMLLSLATRCQAVICCRVSPLQKALIVKLVKDGLGSMCLAIGDGANDVSMIQAADVGVGVAGEEGLQAVNSSDYAIGQFRFLCKLLFVHGHWSYMRNSSMIVNFFYKEIIGIGILFFFQFYCAFSTTTVYEYTLLLFWNVFWTLLPVLGIGIFDRNLDYHVIMQVPEVYRYGIENKWFGLKRFTIYMIDGVYASAVCFFFLFYAYHTSTARRDGYDVYIYEFSSVMAIIAVIIANFYNGLNTHAWNWWILACVLVGPTLILCYVAVYASISPGWIWTNVYGLNQYLWPSAYYWFGMFFCFFVSLIPKYLMRYWNELYRATDIDILKFIAKQNPKHDFKNDPMIPSGRRAPPRQAYSTSDPSQGVPMQSLAQQGRRMTDMSTGLAPVSSRGFIFDEDPYPRRSSRPGSRPGSLLAPPETRKRSHSIKIGPVNLTMPNMPNMRSPGATLRKNKKRSGTNATLAETDEPPESPLRQRQEQSVARSPESQPAMYPMRQLSVDPLPPNPDIDNRGDNPFINSNNTNYTR